MQESFISLKGKENRTIVIQNQLTHQSNIIHLEIDFNSHQCDMRAVLNPICPILIHKVSIYDPTDNKFVSMSKIHQTKGITPINFLQPQIVLIRYKKIEDSYNGESDELDSSVDSKQKKDRSKERTIAEVIQVVKQWRTLHANGNTGKYSKMSLLDAARATGISKKSLDDYYYQLRLGEHYGFNFVQHMNSKIGVLRAFVKGEKPEKEHKHRNMKHPKNLKVIEETEIPPPRAASFSPLRNSSPAPQVSMAEEPDSSQSNPFAKDLVQSFENQFFRNFEFMLDEPNDPFISVNFDFKKKQSAYSEEQFYF